MADSHSGSKASLFSRRDLLKRASVVGAAAVLPVGAGVFAGEAEATVVQHDALQAFTPGDADILDALVGRLVPADAWPGAVEAGVTHYIDQSIAGALRSNAIDYAMGLPATDAASLAAYRTPFAKATDAQKDALITQMQNNTLKGFNIDSRTFFNLVREHTLQGCSAIRHGAVIGTTSAGS